MKKTTKFKIQWESWNEKEREHLSERKAREDNINKTLNSMRGESFEVDDENDDEGDSDFGLNYSNVITPFGIFTVDSLLKPTDRWDCWLGHTNFTLTRSMVHKLNRDVEGIAALNILDKYTFCIGVARSFEISAVRKEVEKILQD